MNVATAELGPAPLRTRTTTTMQVAVIAGPGQVRLERQPIPSPTAHQVRVRVQGCGVCGSNLPIWEGRPWFDYPLEPGAPGHEGWGLVDQVGSGVRSVREGQRVAFLSSHAFAEYDVADEDSVVPLPRELDQQPFPAEPLACAINVFRRCRIENGQTVAVVGIGFLGALLVQLASKAGAKVIAVSRREDALRVAGQFGATALIGLEDPLDLRRQIHKLTGGRGCECVIEATGFQEPLSLAGELVAVRGRLVIAGYHQDGLRQVNLQSWNWRGIDVINAHERDPQMYLEGMRLAIDAVRTGRLTPGPLFTHRLPLAQLGKALDLMRNRPPGFMKALMEVRS